MTKEAAWKFGRKPIVGLAGFFGYGNYGDELFVEVFREFLADRFELRILSDLKQKPYYSRPIDQVVEDVDAIVIGGGDIVQPWGMDPRYFSMEFLKRPVFVIGVGVPIRTRALNPNHVEKDWIIEKYARFFSHPSMRMIHARDRQSADWIRKKTHPKLKVIEAPDIVCALTLPPAQRPGGAPILGVVTRQRPGKEDDYTELNALVQQQREKGWHIRHIILGTGDVGERDLEDAVDIVGEKELVYSESLDDLSRAIGECSALASMKFHGTVVATMYGVPSMVLIPTNKNRNFMHRIARDELVSDFGDPRLCQRFGDGPAPIDPGDVRKLRKRSREVMTKLAAEISAALAEGDAGKASSGG